MENFDNQVALSNEPIILSDRDFERFEEIMAADSEPTEIALRGAAEFRSGTMDCGRYY